RILLSTISLDLFAVLFSGATALIPVFAQDILHVGADAGGLLRSAQGFGATATALLLTQFPLQRHVGRRLFLAVGLFGVAAIVFGLSGSYWLSFAALLVLGAGDMVSVYIRGTLVPLATPDELRGRVTAVESVFIGASNELGMFVAGTGGALLGPVMAVLARSLDASQRLQQVEGNGGPGRNRTDVRGFAVLCMATLPPGRKRPDQETPDRAAVFGERTYRAETARWSSAGSRLILG